MKIRLDAQFSRSRNLARGALRGAGHSPKRLIELVESVMKEAPTAATS